MLLPEARISEMPFKKLLNTIVYTAPLEIIQRSPYIAVGYRLWRKSPILVYLDELLYLKAAWIFLGNPNLGQDPKTIIMILEKMNRWKRVRPTLERRLANLVPSTH
jgi:hypothetical protein